MASGKQGILGALSGRVANVVCSSWKGIAVFKSLPPSVANPRTVPQIEQRTRMTNVVAFAVAINTSVIKPLWDRFQTMKSGYNAFVQTNISLFDNQLPSNPEAFVLSRGKMSSVNILSITAQNNSNQVTVTWSTAIPDSFSSEEDKIFMVLTNNADNSITFSADYYSRSAGTIEFHLKNPVMSGDELVAYLAFRRADGTVVSNSSSFIKVVA